MMEFVIPVTRNDLLTSTISSYFVNELVCVRNLPLSVQSCQKYLVREGHRAIFKCFDILFSVLHEWKSVDANTKEDAWSVVLKGCEVSVRELASVIKPVDPNSSFNRSDLLERRNAVKMHAYLLCQFIEIIENDSVAEASAAALNKVGRGRGKATTSAAKVRRQNSDISLDWSTECSNALTVLDQLCKLEIRQFWDPPVVEEDFVNLLANSSYKLLENKSLAANAGVRTAITNLLSTLIQRYKHSIACCLKLAQMLQCFAHTATVFSSIVNTFMADESMVPFVKELLNEICSYNGEDLERDATGTHNLCTFLDSVSSTHPSLATSILPTIRARLSEDPYQMRNCALNVIGQVLCNLGSDHAQMVEKDKIQRDRLMDVLQEHIHDVNGFVRSRALQIWCNIASSGGLPIKRQVQLVNLLVGPEGAVFDVSSLARKHALRLFTIIITQSPAAKLTKEDFSGVLNKEQERLQILEHNFGHLSANDANLLPNPAGGTASVENHAANTEEEGEIKASRKCRGRNLLDSDDEGDETMRQSSESQEDGSEIEQEERVRNKLSENLAEEQGVSEAAAALEAVIHSAAEVAQEGQMGGTSKQSGHSPHAMSAEVAFEAQKADLIRQKACVAYLLEMQRFADYVTTGIEDIRNMLHSKTTTDVLEAIEFFLTAKQAGVRNLDAALRHMMAMIWSQEEQIRKSVLDASRRLYFQPDIVNESFTEEGRLSPAAVDAVISTLVNLVSESSLGDFVSLERILRELLDLGHVDEDLKQELWTRFTTFASTIVESASKVSQKRKQELKALLILLKMTSSPSRRNLELHLSDLVNYGLGDSMGYANVDLECAIEPFRLPVTHTLCTSLRKLLISTFTSASRIHWIPLMEQAVATIFQLIETPTIVMAEVIHEIGELLLKSVSKRQPPIAQSQKEQVDAIQTATLRSPVKGDEALEEEGGMEVKGIEVDENVETTQPPSSQTSTLSTVPSFILARFIALAGHIALKILVHLEFSVLNELKRREALQEENKNAKKRHAKVQRASARNNVSVNTTLEMSRLTEMSGVGGNTSTAEEEAALLGAVADDAEADYVRNVLNSEVVLDPGHLLTRLLPIVVHVCTYRSRYSDHDLQAAASLSLVKFMLVSSTICEQNLQLLFTLAERSPSEVVRANLIVGLGDLARRFPNLIEPWTPNLYARLRDDSAKVRINALNTLSHLILNDMVKVSTKFAHTKKLLNVKGQISEMTVCLVDQNDRLKQLSRLFFRELAQKGNALYNVMPDIISRLSDPEVGVDEDKFRLIVNFLFPLIEKERLCETLVEKICSRFRVTQTEKQWRDLAYCLRVMSFNERMIRTLQENLPIFAQQLSIPDVHASFVEILTNAKKNTKAEILPQIEELEAKIEEFHQKGVADEEALRRAEVMAKKASSKRRRTAAGGGLLSPRKARNRARGDDEDDEVNTASPRKTRSRAGPPLASAARPRTKNHRAIFSSDEEDEDQPTYSRANLIDEDED
ncbi:unnamed protein product [Rodentolepis nana]|uniref:Condensin complex subunit 1 n=1 Tax=Rodentolepis nana TaxID=102285 RepID=A0A158QI71_RODNA|nr:unnamed protein product [Rodentolepis nana]